MLEIVPSRTVTVQIPLLDRHTDLGEDVIDIIVGADIIERHVCHTAEPIQSTVRPRRFCIEELALYR